MLAKKLNSEIENQETLIGVRIIKDKVANSEKLDLYDLHFERFNKR